MELWLFFFFFAVMVSRYSEPVASLSSDFRLPTAHGAPPRKLDTGSQGPFRAGSLVPTTVKDLSLGTTHRGKILEGWAGGTVLTIQMDLLFSYGDTPAGIEIPTCQIVTRELIKPDHRNR